MDVQDSAHSPATGGTVSIAIRNANDISNLVKGQRRNLGLTQTALATQAGVSRRWLAGLEAGDGGTHIDKILATLDVLGITVTAATATDQPASKLADVIARHTT